MLFTSHFHNNIKDKEDSQQHAILFSHWYSRGREIMRIEEEEERVALERTTLEREIWTDDVVLTKRDDAVLG